MFELMVELFFVSSVQRADTAGLRKLEHFCEVATFRHPSFTTDELRTTCATAWSGLLAKGCCLRALSFPALSPLESLWAPAGGDSPPVGDRHDCVFIHNPKNIDQTFLVALVPALLQGTQVDEAGGATPSWSTRL
jgi:hypothetical protein